MSGSHNFLASSCKSTLFGPDVHWDLLFVYKHIVKVKVQEKVNAHGALDSPVTCSEGWTLDSPTKGSSALFIA